MPPLNERPGSGAAVAPGTGERPATAGAHQRIADAEAEFDAALAAGLPLRDLVARDHELRLATASRDALR